MAKIAQLETDPAWIPHQIAPEHRLVEFVRFGSSALDDPGFLANQPGEASVWLSYDEVLALRPAEGPVHFIFHSGFCRSTLLLHALTAQDQVTGLNEPEILNSLARTENPDADLIRMIVKLLSRPRRVGDTTLIKPSNFQNQLIPSIMRASPDARVILMTNTLDEFLRAIVRKGLLGRQWGRQTFFVASAYTGSVEALRPLIPGMTDLQVAGLGWLLMQNWFLWLRDGSESSRIAVLHSADFDQHRERSLTAVSAHLGLYCDPAEIGGIVTGPVFTRDAKTGADYLAKQASDAKRSSSPVIEDELREVGEWIAELARVSRLQVPVAQTLA
jgi:hypothetical protein